MKPTRLNQPDTNCLQKIIPYGSPLRLAVWAFLICWVMPSLAPAQNATTMPIPAEPEYPFKRDMAKGKFDKADEKIKRRIARDSNNLECHYAAYCLYSTEAFSQRNLDTAYWHLIRVRTLFANADEKKLERWSRDSYSGSRIDYDLYRLGCLAIADANKIRTPDAYQRFLNHYPLTPALLRDSATNSRDSLEFDIACLSGSVVTLQDFIDRRPHSTVQKDAIIFRDSLAFDEANAKHSYTAYQHFRVTYPQSHLYGRATDSVYIIEYRDVITHNSEQYFRGYAERYPYSPYSAKCIWWADSIEFHRETDTSNWHSLIQYLDIRNRLHWSDTAAYQLAQYAIRHQHVPAATEAIQRIKSDSPYYRELGEWLHHAYLHTSITHFDRFYHSPLGKLVPAQRRMADSLALDRYLHYDYRHIDNCIRAIAPYHEAYIMLQHRIKDDIDHNRWNNALNTVLEYNDLFGNDYDYRSLVATLEAKADASVKTTSLGNNINSPKGDEYAPVVSANERTLYFAAQNRPENIGGEDIFVAHRNGNKWGPASIEIDLSHSYGNEAPVSISTDGNSIILYQNGILYQADKTKEGWNEHKLPATINSSSWQSDASLAANGLALLFAAKGLSDHEVDSSLNLYVSLLDEYGEWGAPIDLGNKVNTPFDERSPFLHPDMRTLYFSSEGHGALGEMDVYMTRRLDDTWTHWSTPINLGKGVNTSGDDWGYKITSSGDKAYYSRRINNSHNIYTTTLPLRTRPQKVATVSGIVTDHNGKPLSTLIRWESLSTGKLLGQCRSSAIDGRYTLILPYGESYGIYVNDSSLFPTSQTIDLQDRTSTPNHMANFKVVSYRQMVGDSLSVLLNNVTFDVSNGSPTITSQSELIRLAQIIKKHRFKAIIECHLDGDLGDKANIELSKLRAAAIRDILIENGCRASDIVAIGRGSDYPLPYEKGSHSRPKQRCIVLRLF